MAKSKQTPLIKQYNRIKSKYPDTILLFRLGDFYETFNEDAITVAKVCGITLTKRNNGAAGEMPLAGFPHHQLDNYLPKIVKAGFRAAVCEQLEDPKQAKGIVKRGVTEVVTPGVALYDKLLDSKKNNFLAAVYIEKLKNGPEIAALSFTDASTGEFFTSELLLKDLLDNLESILPAEIIIPKNQKSKLNRLFSKLSYEPSITYLEEWIFEFEFCYENLIKQFKTKNLKGFGIENSKPSIIAAGVVVNYLNDTQNVNLKHLNSISLYDPSEYMILDSSTRMNLEITFTLTGEKDGSLFSLLDRTNTPMGSRLLKKWISRPLKNLEKINQRLNAVECFYNNDSETKKIIDILSEFSDLERLSSKIATMRINPRELVSLKRTIKNIPVVKQYLDNYENPLISAINNELVETKRSLDLLENSIKEDPSSNVGTGNVFKDGFNETLDEYKTAKYSGKNWIENYQKNERERTGINSLKIGFNNVFGYYIEVTKTHSDKIPEDYNRKQTLTNSERYITPELKEFETKILTAEENIEKVEKELYNKLILDLLLDLDKYQKNSKLIATIDCLISFNLVSKENNYIKPVIDESFDFTIINGRHPVVEKSLNPGEKFTSNDTKFDENNFLHIVTGPNMAGKSCYLRQNALIVLMGQIGCFVPAEKANFGMVDKIYTRVGASDNIRSGESTFLVEMQEAANILNNASERSLILLDEVGRGTATFDGISIAWAISEYIHNKIKSKTLFATHYHELNDLANRYEGIKNFKVDVIERDAKIIFTHKVKEGQADHSFGIYVAKMAGLPYDIVKRADEIMNTLEADTSQETFEKKELHSAKPDMKNIKSENKVESDSQMAIFAFEDDKLRNRLKELNIESITPLQAFNILGELIDESKK